MTDKLVGRLRELVQVLVDNDPDEPVADNGCTVFDLWRPDAVKTLAAITKALASSSVPDRQWQPISTAPKDGTPVLLFSPDASTPGIFVGLWIEFDDGGDPFAQHWSDLWTEQFADADPTHWMPLPPPTSPTG